MSLIDEALKRARLEAAQRAAESEGLPYPTIPRHLAPPRRRRWLAPAAVAVAVTAGLVVGVLLASRGEPRPDQLAAVGGGDDAQPVTSGPARPADALRDPAPRAADTAAPEGAPAAAPSADTPPASAAPDVEPAGPPAVPPPAAAQPVTSGPASPAELVRDQPAPREPPVQELLPERSPAASPPAAAEPPAANAAGTTAEKSAEGSPASPPRPALEAGRSPQSAAPADRPPGRPEPSPPAAEPTPPAAQPPPPASAAPQVEAAPAPPPRPAAAPPEPPATTTLTDPDSGMLLVLPERQAAAAGKPAEALVESHVQKLPLPDGGAIELGGIAWSETGPFALINGRVVGPGSTIGDFTLERIQPGHVELAGAGRRIRLSLQ